MISSFLPAAINHLLAQDPLARDRLARHAGKVARVDTGWLPLALRVAADGMLEAAGKEAAADVTLFVKASDLPLIAQDPERAFSYVRIEGDADFADALSKLSRALRWDAEADLSKVVGDIAAVRLVAGARAAFSGARNAQRKLAENVSEFLVEEQPLLTGRPALDGMSGELAVLRDDVERLAKRIERLKGALA